MSAINWPEREEVKAAANFQPKAKQTSYVFHFMKRCFTPSFANPAWFLHSPYLTTLVSLLVGPKKAHYTVPRAFLSESPQWSRSDSLDFNDFGYGARIDLPGVNKEAGHTLVHYLYTGTFQKLQSPEDEDLKAELKNNVHLYGVAANYGLAGLKELVLEKIQTQEGSGDIFDTLDAIKEGFKTLCKMI